MIRVGIGGWNFAPWRDNFYPKGLAHARELHFASRAVTTIEVNSTFYRSQKPATFRKWAEETPDDFVFSVKALMFTTHRRVLAEAGPSVEKFLGSGIRDLGKKLGPVVWQFGPTKKFEPEDFEAFLALLPQKSFRHAVEVRHVSFVTAAFVKLARKYNAAIVLADSVKYPLIADVTADFVYARLQNAQAKQKAGYAPAALKNWEERFRTFEAGGTTDLPLLDKPSKKQTRDVFVYMINGAKERAPAAAQALLKRLG